MKNEKMDVKTENGVAAILVILGEYAEELEKERQLQEIQGREGSEFGTECPQVGKDEGSDPLTNGFERTVEFHKRINGFSKDEKEELEEVPLDAEIHKLHIAAKKNDTQAINMYIKEKYNLNVEDASQSTALLIAAIYQNYEAAKIIRQAHVDVLVEEILGPNAPSQDFYYHHKYEMEMFHTKIFVGQMINKGLDAARIGRILAETNCNLEEVVQFRNSMMTREFLKYCNDENVYLTTVFQNNMFDFDLELIRVLITCEPKIQCRKREFVLLLVRNICDYEKCTAGRKFLAELSHCEFLDLEFFTLLEGHFQRIPKKVVKIFFKYRYDTLAKTKYDLDITRNLFGNPRPKIISLLKNQDLDKQFCGKNTSLHISAKYSVIKNIRLLLSIGADPNALNDERDSPLSLSLKNRDHANLYTASSIKLLLFKGASLMTISCLFENTFFGFKAGQISNEFVMEMIKPLVAQLAVHEATGQSIEQLLKMFMMLKNEKLEKYLKECRQQLESMKTHEICNSRIIINLDDCNKFTIFTILAEKPEKIARYIGDQRLQTLSKLKIRYYKRTLNLYYRELLKLRIMDIIDISFYRNQAIQIICLFTGINDLNHLVVNKVVDHFTVKDLLFFKDKSKKKYETIY